MSANTRWPDFQLASRLRSLIGSQSNVPEATALETTSPQLGGLEREAQQLTHDHDRDAERDERIDTMAAIHDQPIDAIDGIEDYRDDGAAADVDADFGDLEMFDSNASQAPFSSQIAQPLKSEEPVFPAPSSSGKRDKKKKKVSSRTSELASDELDSNSKRKKSKRKPLQDDEIPDSQPANETSNGQDATQIQPDGHQNVANDVAAELPIIPSSQSKKKRKLSDSAEGERRKKRKGGNTGDEMIQGTQEGSSGGPGDAHSTTFLHKDNNTTDIPLGAINEDESASIENQTSPSVARLRRRSQSDEARSRENSVPFRAAVAPMSIDSLPRATDHQERSQSGDVPELENVNERPNGLPVDPEGGDQDVENLAREAWHEHVSSQHEKNETVVNEAPQGTSNTNEEPTSSGQQGEDSPKRRRSSRVKKAKPTFFEQPTPLETPSTKSRKALRELPSPSANTPKSRGREKRATRQKKTAAPKLESSQLEENVPEDDEEVSAHRNRGHGGYTQGRFTDAELARIGHALEAFRVENGLTQFEVNEMIQAPGGTSAGNGHAELWLRLVEECPDRKRQKVINVARKRFHNFVARGTWTLEQDAELSSLIEVHGTAWSKIAGIINRHPEDVRDRYRNYIVCGANQRKDVWNEEEEAHLTEHVKEAMDVIDELRISQPDNVVLKRPYEELVDWQNISEKMGRTRSRLQCITKWKAMQGRGTGKKKKSKKAKDGEEPDATQAPAPAPTPAPNTVSNEEISSQLDIARQQLSSIHEEEQYRLILAIQGASVLMDEHIPWTKLLDKKFRSRWNRGTMALLWDRLKQTVPDWESKSVLDNAQHIINEYNRTGGLPEVSGSGYDDDDREVDILRQLRSRGRPSAPAPKSAEFVVDSGAEEEAQTQDTAKTTTVEMSIDPALTQEAPHDAPPSAQKPTPSKKAAKRQGSAKKKSKKIPLETQDPIEDGEPTLPLPTVQEGEESNIEEQEPRKKKTPSKFKAVNNKGEEEPMVPVVASFSDSDMDDMDDLPARTSA